jgi:UDP-glucose 4-epimerase
MLSRPVNEEAVASSYRNRRVLITGGAGFIGSNLARRLVGLGATVTVVDNLFPSYGGNRFNLDGLNDAVRFELGDVRDGILMSRLVRDQDHLFNLAGQTSHMDSMADPNTDLEINARAQLSILEACRHHNPAIKVVFASTRQIYGKPDYLPVDERHLLRPVDVNGINKMAGEWYHVLYNNVYGVRSTSLRLTNTFGPRMRVKDARQTFVGIWIKLILEGKSFEVWGGEQKRDYTFVDDCIDAMLLAGANEKSNGQIYNLGGDAVYTLAETAQALVEANDGTGTFAVREYPADRKKIDIGDYYADYFSIMSSLGWTPRTRLVDGLRKTLQFYREHLKHYLG